MSELTVRRASVADIPAIRGLMLDDDFILKKRYSRDGTSNLNLHTLIETNFLCVAVVDAADAVVGFAAFTDSPHRSDIPAESWEEYLRCGWLSQKFVGDVYPCNALWLTCLIVGSGFSEYDLALQMLTTALATLVNVHHFLYALPDDVPAFSPLCDIFHPCEETGATVPASVSAYHDAKFKGRIYRVARNEVIPELQLRKGVVEDYDDFMPLLLNREGVVTPLPANLFLEELLQDQDEWNAVVVATDRATQQVVGLMCLKAAYEEQQHLVKQYSCELFAKLKPIVPNTAHRGQQAGHNVAMITFFYLNPRYDNCAGQFIPYAFQKFPFAEYLACLLPHAAPVHPLLHEFEYVPIKKFQPSTQGDKVPTPDGLYVVCRYAFEPVQTLPIGAQHEAAVGKLLQAQTELSQDSSEDFNVKLAQSVPVGGVKRSDLPFQGFVAVWRDAVVGAVVTKRVPVDQLYALRANFDIESFVNFSPHGAPNYAATDFEEDPFKAPQTYYTDDMPGIVLVYCYVKPVFRHRLRLILRDVLRLTASETILFPAQEKTEVYTALLTELVLCPPRRIVEFADDEAPIQPRVSADVAPLMTLHCTSRKLLSDEKTHINARIIVVGASNTGLAFIYALLQISYLHFSNILLVNLDGLPPHPLARERMWTVDTMDWTEREYLALRVGKRVRVIEGTVIDFERQDRYIYTSSQVYELYDHLILTVGRQYTVPEELLTDGRKRAAAADGADGGKDGAPGARRKRTNGVFPLANSHVIADIQDHIRDSEQIGEQRSRVVVYGGGLDAFAIVTCLIDLRLEPQRIVVVQPPREKHAPASPFQDDVVDRRVKNMLDTLRVQVKTGKLERLEYDEDNSLSSVVIGDEPEMDCTMLIYADQKDIDAIVLQALTKRSIVFDGRVIVENSYRTADRHIYAAGPVAMFSARFGPSEDFDIYNTLEVGTHLCHTVLGLMGIDEFHNEHTIDDEKVEMPKEDLLRAQLGTFKEGASDAMSGEEIAKRRPKPLPVYKEKLCKRVKLPQELTFFTCYSVGYHSMEAAGEVEFLRSFSDDVPPVDVATGRPLARDAGGAGDATDDVETDPWKSYLRLAIGRNGRIESVVYLGRDPREIHNFRALVGTPESQLNLRYNYHQTKAAGGRLDIQAYLRQRWARALLHDQYPRLWASLQEKLKKHADLQAVKADMLARIRASSQRWLSADDRE